MTAPTALACTFLMLGLSVPLASAATYSDLLIYKGGYTGGSGCSAPQSAKSFTLADQQAHFYVLIQGMTPADNIQVQWVFLATGEAPWYHTLTVSSSGNWCFPFA